MGRDAFEIGFLGPLQPLTHDDFIAFAPFGNERGDNFRRILKIGIDNDGGIAGRRSKTRRNRILVPEVARQTNDANVGARVANVLQNVRRAILAAVIDEDDFIIGGDAGQYRSKARVGRFDDLLFVEAGNDNRQLHSLILLMRLNRRSQRATPVSAPRCNRGS